MKPELERYTQIAWRIKEKSKERNTLLSEKKATPVLNILKHRDLSRRIAELTEKLEELRSEKKQILAMMDYAEDTQGLETRRCHLLRLIQDGRGHCAGSHCCCDQH